MQLSKCLSVWLCASGMIISGQARAMVIDNFDSGPGVVSSDGIAGPLNLPAAGALGGSRTLQILGFPTDADPVSDGAALEVATPPNATGHSQNAFAPGGRSMITWDANGAGLGGLDLTDGGLSNGIKFDLLSIDVGSVDATVKVVDTSAAEATLAVSDLMMGSNHFMFADFLGSVDFAAVDAVMLVIDADKNSDLRIDLIQTIDVAPSGVPEPMNAVLSGMALGTLAHATRRRRRR